MRALLVVGILLVAPVALAQEHEHGGDAGGAMVLRDGPEDGRAIVGAYTHLGFALLDKDARPVVHQNAEFVVTQAGKVVFATTDTHEYDGLFSFDLRFTQPGPYEVVATSGEMTLGTFRGEVIEPVAETEATVELVSTGSASNLVDFELSILDPAGAVIEHTDAIVEFRTVVGDALHARTHLHIHDAPIVFSQAFTPGDFVVEVVAYKAFATGRSPDVRAVFATFPLTVGAGAQVAPPPLPTPTPPAPLEQRGAVATADGLTLHAMYDPNNQVGAAQLARIVGAVTQDANHTTLPHVDFEFTLAGPLGLVYSTASGHEYDGVFEYVFRPPVPGVYQGSMTATYDETVLVVPIELVVVPPAVPLLGGTGPITVGLDGIDGVVAGEEANLTFSAMGPSGPAAHSEVDVTIFHDDEPPLYQFKLHTHDSGLTNAVVRFPHAGPWKVRVDPLPTVPEASVYTSALFAFEVAEGSVLPLGEEKVEGAPAAIPGGWPALALVALAGVAFWRRVR